MYHRWLRGVYLIMGTRGGLASGVLARTGGHHLIVVDPGKASRSNVVGWGSEQVDDCCCFKDAVSLAGVALSEYSAFLEV